jgi:2-phosphoglycerate kinase
VGRSLANVVWIGGSPCAGKSSIADAIAREQGWIVYRCDDEVERHARLADPVRQPILWRLNRLSGDDLWMRPLDQQVEEEFAYYRDEFAFICEDLERLPSDRTVIAEGAALLPELIEPKAVEQGRAIWIVPAPEFQREHYARRDWTTGTLSACSNPAAAWENWMERDVRFARRVEADAAARNFPVLVVDGVKSLTENIANVRDWLRVSS